MAAVYEAYNFLNEQLKLGLDVDQLVVIEQALKKKWLEERGYKVSSKSVQDWEIFAIIEPRQTGARGAGRTDRKKRPAKRSR